MPGTPDTTARPTCSPSPSPQPAGLPLADVYVCAAVRPGRSADPPVALREELIRLVVHGTLHALGYDHPDGPERARSPMWRRQERYVEALA